MKSDWTKSTIGEVCVLVTDGSHFSPKSVEKGRPMVSVKDFTEYGFNFSSCKSISEEDWLLLERNGCVPCYNDILIGKDGARYFEDIIIYRQDEKPALLSSIAILRCDENVVIPEFLYHMLRTPSFRKDVRDNYGSGSAIPRIILKDFKRMPVFYPPLETQRKIAAILSALDDKIELNRRINANLEQQLNAVFKAWFQKFTQVKATRMVETQYGAIPTGWRWDTLGNLCESVSKTHKFDKQELIFLNTGDIENGQFLHSNYTLVEGMPGQAKKTIEQGDVLYSEIRPINRHFAYVNFQADDYVVSTKLMVIRAKAIDSRRLYHFLTQEKILAELQMQAESRSGTFPQIRFDNVGKLPILIADEKTEAQFIDLLHISYAQIERNNLESEQLAAVRNALLPRLMSGEIDVSDVSL